MSWQHCCEDLSLLQSSLFRTSEDQLSVTPWSWLHSAQCASFFIFKQTTTKTNSERSNADSRSTRVRGLVKLGCGVSEKPWNSVKQKDVHRREQCRPSGLAISDNEKVSQWNKHNSENNRTDSRKTLNGKWGEQNHSFLTASVVACFCDISF